MLVFMIHLPKILPRISKPLFFAFFFFLIFSVTGKPLVSEL